MIDPKTYEKALRAARNVARSSGRAAVGLGLLANTSGCLTSDTSGGAEADAVADAALSDAAADVVSDVVDAVMADLAMDTSTPPETTTSDATVADAPTEDVGSPDASIADATTSDAGTADAAITDASPGDVLTEVIEGDGTSTVIADPCVCLTPTDLACTGWEKTDYECTTEEDCSQIDWQGSDTQCNDAGFCEIGSCVSEDEEFSGLVCYEGVCSAGEGFGECCEAAYNNEECMMGAIPGCTPWGPPAPGAYDGLTLADYGLV